MSTIVTRSGKGSPLTHNEVDTNFTNLNTDKVEKTAADITGGTINNTTVGATTPSTGVFTTLTATGQTSLGGVAGAEGLRVTPLASSTTYINARAGINGGNAQIGLVGTGNTDFVFYTLGTGAYRFLTGGIGPDQFRISHTASAVNYVQVTGAATGSPPTISAQGSDAAVDLTLNSKSTGVIRLQTNGINVFRLRPASSPVNFFDVYQSATGKTPYLQSVGSDTNVPFTILTQGTGAIDLAAGSRGVNISNGGTVTALTITAGGNYTSLPTVAITAPTTAGGVQATASANMRVSTGSTTLASGGTGYTAGDVLTFSGGTFATAAQITVNTVSAGVIATFTVTNAGVTYTALPANPVSVTGGTGSGATFNASWAVQSVSITNAGSGYVEQPTVTFSGGGGSGAAAYATVGSGTVVRTLGSSLSFSTPSGEAFRVSDLGTTPSSYWTAFGGTTAPFLRANGSSGGVVETSGTTPLLFRTNSGTEQLRVAHTASAVNYVQVTGAATGSGPIISAQGSDTDVRLNFTSKGTNSIDMLTNSAGTRQFRFSHTASAVNYLQATGSIASSGPVLSSQGTDTNIDLNLTPKGTGNVRFGTYTGTALSIAGFIEIKDSGGTVRKLAVVA